MENAKKLQRGHHMNQRIRLTKRLLHESLLDLLDKRTIDDISVKELCGHAGINRSTFYAHYGCVRDVITEIEWEITEKVRDICRREASDPKTALEHICEYLYRMKSTELILFRNHTDTDLSFAFESLSAEFYHTGNYDIKPQDEKLTLAFVNYGVFNLIKTWLSEDIEKTPKEIADLLLDRILRAF